MAFLLPPALKRSECFLGDSRRMHDGGGKVLATICHTHLLSRDYTLVICYLTITHLPLLAPTDQIQSRCSVSQRVRDCRPYFLESGLRVMSISMERGTS